MSTQKQPELHSEADQDNKKMMQSILELGRQLDYATSKCDSVEGLFTSELLVRRTKMKDMCIKLLLQLPSKYSLQTRERLWRSVCYDVMCRAKRLKKDNRWTPSQFWLIRNHLVSGIGHISYLLLTIQELPKFQNLSLRYFNSGVLSIRPPSECLQTDDGSNIEFVEKWFEELLYYSLLNIGDLYRYLTDIYSSIDDELYWHYYNLAQDCYSRAFFINTEYGMAHNQLGNLNLKLNGGLDSTYYLLYSMSSPIAYEGSHSNLRHLLDKQLVEFATISAAVEWRPLDAFAQGFLSVTRQFLFETTRAKNFEKMCQDTLASFSQVLMSGDPDLDTKLFFRVSLTAIMNVWWLQSNNSTNVSTAVALAMGIFVQLTDRLLSVLNVHSHAPAPLPPSALAKINSMEGMDTTSLSPIEVNTKVEDKLQVRIHTPSPCKSNEMGTNIDEENLIVPVKVKNKVIPMFGRRRRLRRIFSSEGGICYSSDEEDEEGADPRYHIGGAKVLGSSDGDESATGQSDESDFEGDEYWTEGDSESGRSSCMEKSKSSASQTEQPAFEDSNSSIGLSDSPPIDPNKNVEELSSELDHLKWESNADGISALPFVIDSEELMQCWSQAEPLLIALLPFMRWLQTSPAVTDAIAGNCEKVFLTKLCKIMNLLKSINWDEPYVDMVGETNQVTESFRTEWNILLKADEVSKVERQQLFSYEMSEDRSMVGLQQFKNITSGIKRNINLLKGEMMMTRVARILIFGHWLSETESFTVLYSKTGKEFIVPTPVDLRRHLQNAKLDLLKNKLEGGNCKEFEKLTHLWKAANLDLKRKNTYTDGKNNRGGYRRRGLARIGRNSVDSFIFIFVDLPAILKHFGIIRHLATHPKFVIVLPHSVSKTLDIMKETEIEGSQQARMASRWLERAGAKGYNEVRTQREHEKTRINTTYPTDYNDETETWEFFDVLENCNFLRTQELKGAGRPPEKFFGDVRDKYRILYLTGHTKILQPSSEIDFNPIEAARLTNVFVDKITAYASRRGRRRRQKNGKING